VEYALKVGNANFAAMEALDHGHVGKYGHPEPTKVRVSPVTLIRMKNVNMRS
jgi:hydroxylamine reductase